MFRRAPHSASHAGEEENPFLLSFSDLMASLLAIFILALIVMMVQLHKKKQELEKKEQTISLRLEDLRKTLIGIEQLQARIEESLSGVNLREHTLASVLKGVQEELKDRGIEVVVAENGSVLRIPEQALHFSLGKYEIPPEFQPSATAIGQALLMALQREENRTLLDTVFIEGHTDAVRNAREMGNWRLSTYRAISLWQFWTEKPGLCAALTKLQTPARDQHHPARPLISVSGYGATRPTGSAPPAAAATGAPLGDNSADRRIDIRFTLAASEKKNLEDVKGQLQEMRGKTRGLIDKLQSSER